MAFGKAKSRPENIVPGVATSDYYSRFNRLRIGWTAGFGWDAIELLKWLLALSV
jgi:hypothetical protein